MEDFPVPFWASLQVCDLDVLEDLINKARVAPEYIGVVAKYTCRDVPFVVAAETEERFELLQHRWRLIRQANE